jgi:hypothetical protein
MNLVELPTLFYAMCLAMFALDKLESWDLKLAWVYVGLRAVHSSIHLTYNHVIHRLVVFALSNVVLGVLWLRLWLALP